MSTFQVINPFQQFFGLDGLPLTGGYVYIGAANQDPQTNPIPVYSDQALSIGLAQPLRTVGGYLASSGTPTSAYVGTSPYSIRVRNKLGVEVYYKAAAHDEVREAINSLSGPTGASLLGYKRPEADAVTRPVNKVLDEHVSVTEWGVTGGNAAHDTPLINKAIAQCPVGKELFFPKLAGGNYLVNDTIQHRNAVNIRFDRAAVMIGTFDDPTKDIWNIGFTIGPIGNNDARQMWMRDATIGIIPGLRARDTIHLENAAPLAGNLNFEFNNCAFRANDDQAGYALRIKGIVTQLHRITGCQVENGIMLDGCADANHIYMTQIFGIKCGVTLNLTGVFRNQITHNIIVCRDGAIQGQTSQTDIMFNQMEQLTGAGPNVSATPAMISLGTGADFKGRRNVVYGNNFGGGANVAYGLYLYGDLDDTFVDNNTFNITSSAVDIFIADPKTKDTRIGPNNQPRGGPRNGITIDATTGVATPLPGAVGNQGDPADLLIVLDAGMGTLGSRRVAADTFSGDVPGIGLTNGWTANPNFMYYRDLEGVMHFRGRFIAGATVASNTLICTMPEGFRPNDQILFSCPYGGAGYMVMLKFDVNGEIRTVGTGNVLAPLANTDQVELANVAFLINRQGYDPGV